MDPPAEQFALLIGHVGDIAERHGFRTHRLLADTGFLPGHLRRRFQPHAFWRSVVILIGRAGGVAACASVEDDSLGRGEGNGLLGFTAASWHGGDGNGEEQHKGDGQQDKTLLGLALVLEVEVMPHQHSDQGDAGQQQPAVGIAEGHGIVTADHDEQDRQSEIVVME